MVATRDTFAKTKERRYAEVPIDGLDEPVRLQSLTARERDNYEAAILDGSTGRVSLDKYDEIKPRLAGLCIVDECGEPIYCEATLGELQEADGGVIDQVYDACRKHCRMDTDYEALVKNLETANGDDLQSS